MITSAYSASIGAVTYWSLDADTDLDILRGAWAALGLESLLPEKRSGLAVLRQALQQTQPNGAGGDILIRRTAKKDTLAVVAEQRGEAANDYTTRMLAWLGEDGRVESDPSDPAVAAQYEHLQGRLPAPQVGTALARAVSALGGIGLRPTGGVYWIPAAALERWASVAQGVERAAAHQASTVYVLRTEADAQAVRAVRDGLTAEIDTTVAMIMAELSAGEIGVRAIAHRRDEAVALAAKVGDYENMLGESLEALRAKIGEVEMAAAAAVIAASAAAAKEVQNVA